VKDYEINEFDERRTSRPELNSFLSYLSIEDPDLRNTYLQTVERPRTHDPRFLCDFMKGGIVLQETQGGRGRVVADARM